jgi:AGZA family xanthine/uracil permease-like MFS transporter
LFLGSSCKYDNEIDNPAWTNCIQTFKRNLIAATCIAAFISTFLMGVIANMPLALAPAMGVNAYFTYTIVGYMGFGLISYQYALAAAFIEGWLFIFISVTGVRGKLVELIPKNIMYATACGIGAFLAFIGLQQGEGLALITYGAYDVP